MTFKLKRVDLHILTRIMNVLAFLGAKVHDLKDVVYMRAIYKGVDVVGPTNHALR